RQNHSGEDRGQTDYGQRVIADLDELSQQEAEIDRWRHAVRHRATGKNRQTAERREELEGEAADDGERIHWSDGAPICAEETRPKTGQDFVPNGAGLTREIVHGMALAQQLDHRAGSAGLFRHVRHVECNEIHRDASYEWHAD